MGSTPIRPRGADRLGGAVSAVADLRGAAMILNPRARLALEWRDALRCGLRRLGLRRWWETEAPGHAAELAREAALDGASLLLVGGGDGTLHEVANGLLGPGRSPALPTLPPVLPLPLGTGNDFARSLGLPLAVERAARALFAGHLRRVDAGLVNGTEVFLNVVGFGLDAEVVRVRWRRRTPRTYTPTVLRTLPTYAPLALEVEGEAGWFRGRALAVSVLHGASIGGGYALAPGADPADGEFDVCVFEAMPPLVRLRALWQVRGGRHERLRTFHRWRDRRLAVRGDVQIGHLDGELRTFEHGNTVHVTILPNAFPVLA